MNGNGDEYDGNDCDNDVGNDSDNGEAFNDSYYIVNDDISQ